VAANWESFYVILGSSGAALIGIQFIVVTLIAGMRERPQLDSLHAFATPTVVHFSGVLLVACIMSAPWPSPTMNAVALGVCGFGGVVYSAVVSRRQYTQTNYTPVWQDWFWYAVMPSLAYGAIVVAASGLLQYTRIALFTVAAATLGLLFIGVHNAWDSVTYLVIEHADQFKN
jgi:hypothetical protein